MTVPIAYAPNAYLTRPGEWTYRFAATLGGPPLLVLNDADEFGCLWASEEPEGAAAPSADTPIDGRQYGDGGYAGDTTYEARPLTWTGTTVCPDRQALAGAQARLRSVASSRNPVLYTQEGYPPRSLWLNAVGQPKMRTFDGVGMEWSFTMTAEDPLWFDAAELAAAIAVTLPQLPPGRVYNRVYGGAPTFTETRRNLVPNPAPTSVASWFGTAGTGGVSGSSYVASGGPTGGGYFRVTWTTATTAAAGSASNGAVTIDGRGTAALPIPVTPGTTYAAAISARPSLAQRLDGRLQWYDAANVALTTELSAAQVVPANTWTRFTAAGVAPAGAAYARVAIGSPAGTGAVPYPVGATLDGALGQLEAAAAAGTYFDGSTPAAGSTERRWTGTPSASPSVEGTVSAAPGYVYGAVAPEAAGQILVTNSGDEWAQAIYTITGPVTDPLIANDTTGEFLGMVLTLGALDTLRVETADELTTWNGQPFYAPRTVGSVMPRIAPGPNTVRWSAADLGNTTARLTVAAASTWK